MTTTRRLHWTRRLQVHHPAAGQAAQKNTKSRPWRAKIKAPMTTTRWAHSTMVINEINKRFGIRPLQARGQASSQARPFVHAPRLCLTRCVSPPPAREGCEPPLAAACDSPTPVGLTSCWSFHAGQGLEVATFRNKRSQRRDVHACVVPTGRPLTDGVTNPPGLILACTGLWWEAATLFIAPTTSTTLVVRRRAEHT